LFNSINLLAVRNYYLVKLCPIEEGIVKKKKNYLLLASLCDTYNNELQQELILQPDADVNLMTNHHLEEKNSKTI